MSETTAVQIAGLAAGMELFSCNGEAYVTLPVKEHRETWQVESRVFKDILVYRCLETGKVPSPGALNAVIRSLRVMALWEGAQIPVHVRLGGNDQRIYLDLGDEAWRCVEVTADGWRITDTPIGIRFRRPAGMLELPVPQPGGSLLDLAPFLNYASDDDLLLLLAWLVAALRPGREYPVLGLNGEEGCAKSTVARRLRALLDPNVAMLRACPRGEDDLMIAASNGWVMNFDNVSHLPAWMPDAICRLSTEAGWSKRRLFTDAEEVLFSASRPVILNGIPDLFHSGDLLSRSIILTLPAIPDSARKLDTEMDEAFNQARPHILGRLLDAASLAIRCLPETEVPRLPRMADFARFVCAAAPAMHTDAKTLLQVCKENRELGDQLVIEGSLVAQAVLSLMQQKETWRGSAQELLELLKPRLNTHGSKSNEWPRTGRGLSGELRRVSSALRKRGIAVQFELRQSNIRPITITRRMLGG